MEMQKHTIVVTGNEYLWLFGSVDEYSFAAKVYDEASVHAIDGGRVAKLGLYADECEVVNYERGWDKYPSDTDLEDTMEALLRFLASVPKWKHWREIQRNQPYIVELPKRKKEVIE